MLVDERETYSVDCVFPVLIRVDIGPVLQWGINMIQQLRLLHGLWEAHTETANMKNVQDNYSLIVGN